MKAHFLLPLALFSFILSSCNEDDDTDAVITREDFVGTYVVSDGCIDNYTITVEVPDNSLPDDNDLLVKNIGSVSHDMEATFSGNTLTVPEYTWGVFGQSCNVSGSGTLSGNEITFTYTYTCDDGSGYGTCTTTWYKEE